MAKLDYDTILANANIQAILRVIRLGESNATDPRAYQALFGWKPGNDRVFTSFADHPKQAFQFRTRDGKLLWTSAAGAYQAMCAIPGRTKVDTWGDFQRSNGPTDFSPYSQDKFAVWCLDRRGALGYALMGDIEQVVIKCSYEWASFPGNNYDQGGKKMEDLVDAFHRFKAAGVGPDYPPGASAPSTQQDPPAVAPSGPPVAPVAEAEEPTTSIWSTIMPIAKTALTMSNPMVGLAFEAITGVVPKLLDLFKGTSPTSQRNVEAVKTVVEAVKQTVGAVNEQDLVEKIRSGNPAVIEAVEEGVKSVYYDLEIKFDNVAATRVALVPAAAEGTPFYKTGPFWITVLLLIPVYFVTHNVMTDMSEKNHDLRLMVVTAFISGVLFAIAGFWLGTSMSSQRKTELAARASAHMQTDDQLR